MPRKKKSDTKMGENLPSNPNKLSREEIKNNTASTGDAERIKELGEDDIKAKDNDRSDGHDTRSAIPLPNKRPKAIKPKKQKTMDDVIKQNAIKPKVKINKFKVGDNVRCKVKMETLLRVYSIRMKDHDYPIVYRCLDNMNNFSLICEDMLVLD